MRRHRREAELARELRERRPGAVLLEALALPPVPPSPTTPLTPRAVGDDGSPFTLAGLARFTPTIRKNMIGERLYRLIHPSQPELAGKLTGMLLDLDNADLGRRDDGRSAARRAAATESGADTRAGGRRRRDNAAAIARPPPRPQETARRRVPGDAVDACRDTDYACHAVDASRFAAHAC